MPETEDYSKIRKFPPEFKFGAAISGLQTEKYYGKDPVDSDWKRFLTKVESGKEPILKSEEKTADWFHENNAENDFRYASMMGLDMLRLGIEWARIMPEPNKVDQVALKKYSQWIGNLRARNITPMVTLNHFSLPEWVAKEGGWESSKMISSFKYYSDLIAEHFSDVPYWITVNEPEGVVGMGYLFGEWPPQKTNVKAAIQAVTHIKKANEIAFNSLKKQNRSAKIGTANNINWFEAHNPHSVKDKFVTAYTNFVFNDFMVGQMTDQTDFTGVDFYTGYKLKFKASLASGVYENSLAIRSVPGGETVMGKEPRSDMGWPIVPEYFYNAVRHVYDRFKKPIFITENGIADREDKQRAFYILSHLIALHEAMQSGVSVEGYNHWSLLDNIELAMGTKERFGLVGLDPKTGERTIRQSSELYGKIVRSKTIDVDTLSKKFLTEEQKGLVSSLNFNK